ncbi:hypothetical protein K1719_033231 [Acacia pycnantha]|nr:hypothetical protein K1719_033231 [Acacia pycnantha]
MKRDVVNAGGPVKNEWIQVGSKRKNSIKGVSKGNENKIPTRQKPARGIHVGPVLETINSNQFSALQAVESPLMNSTCGPCVEPKTNNGSPCVDYAQDATPVVHNQGMGSVISQGTKEDATSGKDISILAHQSIDELMSDQDKEAALVRAHQLGFSHMELMDCEGYSGGIWCLWESTVSHVAVLERHHQYMHLQVTSATGSSWNFTVVYASPSNVNRRTLWSNWLNLVISSRELCHHNKTPSEAASEIGEKTIELGYLIWGGLHKLVALAIVLNNYCVHTCCEIMAKGHQIEGDQNRTDA